MVLAVIIVTAIIMVISVFIIEPAPSIDKIARTPDMKKHLSSSVFPWSERIRGITQTVFEGMPPCFEYNESARRIYAIISARNKVIEYRALLDIISILLCQNTDTCTGERSRFKDRYTQVIGSGGNPRDALATDILKVYVKDVDLDKSIALFIVATVNLIQKHFDVLYRDEDFSSNERDSVNGLIRELLSTVVDEVYRKCV